MTSPQRRAWSSADFVIPLPPGHRFPVAKYEKIRDTVVSRGILPRAAIEVPERVEPWALALVHDAGWVDAVCTGPMPPTLERRLGLPGSAALRERSLRTVQATVEAATDALDRGLGISLAGGTHHAFRDRGEGFCVFNDVAIATRMLQREGRIQRVAVLDLDVHQGNGTARIFAGDPEVYTFSMHGASNYPFHREQSRLDIELPDGTGDADYLAVLDRYLPGILQDARPDLVFFLAGSDPYRHDRFGRLGLTIEGLRARDARVVQACRARDIPLAITMAGGYATDLEDIATIHANTVQEALAAYG